MSLRLDVASGTLLVLSPCIRTIAYYAVLFVCCREDFVVWIPTVRKACLATTLAVLATPGGAAAIGASTHGTGGAAAAAADSGPYGTPSGGDYATITGIGGVSSAVAAAAAAAAAVGGGTASLGGVGGTGPGSGLRHDAYERLVCLLLGLGSGYGFAADEALCLYGYGAPPALPHSPYDLAALLYDTGKCSADGSGSRIAAAMALSPTGGVMTIAPPPFGGSVLDGHGGAAVTTTHGAMGTLGTLGTDNDTFGGAGGSGAGDGSPTSTASGGPVRLAANQENLKKTWETTAAARSTREGA